MRQSDEIWAKVIMASRPGHEAEASHWARQLAHALRNEVPDRAQTATVQEHSLLSKIRDGRLIVPAREHAVGNDHRLGWYLGLTDLADASTTEPVHENSACGREREQESHTPEPAPAPSQTGNTSFRYVAEIVQSERRRQRLSVVRLAKMAGVGRRFIYDLEAAKPSCEIAKVFGVLEALGCELQILTSFDRENT